MLKFSRPAKITSPTSVHICCANEYRRTDILMKAYESADPIERMKNVCAFFISGIHSSPVDCKSKAPFNPVIGETYQAIHKDGSKVYFEQTVHHPPTFNFQLYGPDDAFKLMGNGAINAHLDGLNTIRGWRDGKNIIIFKDGTKIVGGNLYTRINGVIMGDRLYNYYGTLTIKDYTNKVECNCYFVDQEKEGVISKFFGKKKTVQYDEFKVEIKQLNPETKEKELKATGYGSWLGQLYFGDKCYWSIDDQVDNWSQEGLFILPSDSCLRTDLNAVLKGDIDLAQKEKEAIEELQRSDQKKRDEFEKSQKK